MRLFRTVRRLRSALKKCQLSKSDRKGKNGTPMQDGAVAPGATHHRTSMHFPAHSSTSPLASGAAETVTLATNLPVSHTDSSSRQLLASTATEPARYEKRAVGRCAVYITSMTECAEAAVELGFSDTTVVDDGKSGSKRDPPGCYAVHRFLLDKYESPKMNMAGTNTGRCTLADMCLCKLPTVANVTTMLPTTRPPTKPLTRPPASKYPTRTLTHVPTQVPTSQLTAPGINELLERCNSVMNTTFNKTSVEEADIGKQTHTWQLTNAHLHADIPACLNIPLLTLFCTRR